jgi:hypothetical protein
MANEVDRKVLVGTIEHVNNKEEPSIDLDDPEDRAMKASSDAYLEYMHRHSRTAIDAIPFRKRSPFAMDEALRPVREAAQKAADEAYEEALKPVESAIMKIAEELKTAISADRVESKAGFTELVEVLETCCEVIQRIEDKTIVPRAALEYRDAVMELANAASKFLERPGEDWN